MMKKQRPYKPAVSISRDTPVKVIACAESPASFRARVDIVQTLIAEMILLARKRGRPSEKEELYEKAA